MHWNLALLAALAVTGCAEMPNRPNAHASGSTWVNAVRNTGSYGNTNAEQRTRALGERTWQGRKAFAYENTATGMTVVTELESGRWIAFAKGEVPVTSFEPALGWDFPLEVGKTWSRKHRVTNHANKTTSDFTGSWKVEAYEDVTVRAGTFKAYKVRYTDTAGTESTTWWSPETGTFVKVSGRRGAAHPAGVGTNESELVQRPSAP
jgi:hypothetical protein